MISSLSDTATTVKKKKSNQNSNSLLGFIKSGFSSSNNNSSNNDNHNKNSSSGDESTKKDILQGTSFVSPSNILSSISSLSNVKISNNSSSSAFSSFRTSPPSSSSSLVSSTSFINPSTSSNQTKGHSGGKKLYSFGSFITGGNSLKRGDSSTYDDNGKYVNCKASIVVKSATNLEGKDFNGYSDPYVSIYCGKEEKKTSKIMKTLEPYWNENFLIDVRCEKVPKKSIIEEQNKKNKKNKKHQKNNNSDSIETSEDALSLTDSYVLKPSHKLRFQVWNWNFLTKDDMLGFCIVDFEELTKNQSQDLVLDLEGSGNGSLHVQITPIGFGKEPFEDESDDSEDEDHEDDQESTQNDKSNKNEKNSSSHQLLSNIDSKPSSVSARYKKTELLGTGSQGVVYLATDTKTGMEIAMKYIACKSLDDATMALQEGWNLRTLSHPNLVEYKNIFFDKIDKENFAVCFTMDYFEDGDLYTFLKHQSKDKPTDLKYVLNMTNQLVSGIQNLHSKNCLHRDLKPQNIFLCDDYQTVKIGDFGFSEEIGESFAYSKCGTIEYLPPETAKNQYSTASDMWSLGVIIYELLTLNMGICHFELANEDETKYREQVKADILKSHPNIEDDASTSQLFKIVVDLLQVDPQKRPTAEQVLQMLNPSE